MSLLTKPPKTIHIFTIAVYCAAFTLLALPIVSVVVPPLGDYPNHLARMHILAAYGDSPWLRENYFISWKPAPYLAMDLIIPSLMHFMSIYSAGRLFLLLCLFLFVIGAAAVHYAIYRKIHPWPAISALVAYNYVVAMGFVNYMFGVGAWLLAFAGWMALSERGVKVRLFLRCLISLAVYLTHFFAFLGYSICVAAYELGEWIHSPDRSARALLRRFAETACSFLLPLCFFLSVPKGQQNGHTEYGVVQDKVTAILSPVLFPGARYDLITLMFVAGIVAVGIWIGVLRIARQMRMPLIVLGAVILLMPNLLVGVWGMDFRYPFVFVLLLIGACRCGPVEHRTTIVVASTALILLAANMGSIISTWKPIGVQYDEFRSDLGSIPRGVRLIAFRDDLGTDAKLKHGPASTYRHLPALAVIERDVYLPFLFKNPMMTVHSADRVKIIDTPHGQPIALSDLVAGLDPAKGTTMLGQIDEQAMRNYWGNWPAHFDYAIELAFGAKPQLPPQLKLVRSGEIFNIYRVKKQ